LTPPLNVTGVMMVGRVLKEWILIFHWIVSRNLNMLASAARNPRFKKKKKKKKK
jgi:hypothetical protein